MRGRRARHAPPCRERRPRARSTSVPMSTLTKRSASPMFDAACNAALTQARSTALCMLSDAADANSSSGVRMRGERWVAGERLVTDDGLVDETDDRLQRRDDPAPAEEGVDDAAQALYPAWPTAAHRSARSPAGPRSTTPPRASPQRLRRVGPSAGVQPGPQTLITGNHAVAAGDRNREHRALVGRVGERFGERGVGGEPAQRRGGSRRSRSRACARRTGWRSDSTPSSGRRIPTTLAAI